MLNHTQNDGGRPVTCDAENKMALDDFVFDKEHGVVTCRQCETCIVPDGPTKWRYHLRRERHRMRGKNLRAAIDLLSTYELRGKDELRRCRPDRRVPCKRINGLAVYKGYICLCDSKTCDFVTRRLQAMHDHVPRHGRTASEHGADGTRLWKSCTLQTYFTAKQLIDYFVVEDKETPLQPTLLRHEYSELRPASTDRLFLNGLRADLQQTARDAEGRAAIVHDLGDARGDRE